MVHDPFIECVMTNMEKRFETFLPEMDPDLQKYRDRLVEELRSAPSFLERREMLLEAQGTDEYQLAKIEKIEQGLWYIDNRALAKKRVEQGLLTEDDAAIPQDIITERFLAELAKDLPVDQVRAYVQDPSPFVRFEAVEIATKIDDVDTLATATRDNDREIRALARRNLAVTEIRHLRQINTREDIMIRLTDIFADVPIGSGERIMFIQRADRDQLEKRFGLSADEMENLNDPRHWKEQVDAYWWGVIDVRVLEDEGKVWILEEFQSDLIQRTKSKELRSEYNDPCETCQGKGVFKISKNKQERCSECQGGGSIPSYPKKLIDSMVEMAGQSGVEAILMPTADVMFEKYGGLLKRAKANLLYDTVPRSLGMAGIKLSEDITFGEEDGGKVTTNAFWRLTILDQHAQAAME